MLREARLKFTRELSATLTVRSVDEHGIRINDELWTETIALTHQKLMPGWTSKAVQELLLEDDDDETEGARRFAAATFSRWRFAIARCCTIANRRFRSCKSTNRVLSAPSCTACACSSLSLIKPSNEMRVISGC